MKCTYLFIIITIFCSRLQAQTTHPFTLGITELIPSKVLAETRALNIYLPPGYENDTATYPVIYLLDGSADEDFVHIAGLVQYMNMIQVMPHAIVVGIGNVDRRRDFTYPTHNKDDLKLVPTSGGSEKFIAYLKNEVQPYIEKKYRISPRKYIIGQSLGGLVATEILLKDPGMFTDYMIVSPSLWWDDESLVGEAPALIKSHSVADSVNVYLSVGNEGDEMIHDAEKIAGLLWNSGKKFRTTYYYMPEENHLTILHNSIYHGLEVLNKKQ